MGINNLCKMLSSTKKIFTGSLVLLMVFGFGCMVYAEDFLSTRVVTITEIGGDIVVELKEHDDIDTVEIFAQCKNSDRALYWWKDDNWYLLNNTGEKSSVKQDVTGLKVGNDLTVRFQCINLH